MTVLKHRRRATLPESNNPEQIQPTDWNDDHVIDDVPAFKDAVSLAPIASSGSASDLTTGSVPPARLPAFSGDVFTSAGSSVVTISDSVITTSKFAPGVAPSSVNIYEGREFHFRDDWMSGSVMYQSLAFGQAVAYGPNWSTDWTLNARIVPITGTGRLGVVALQTGEQPSAICRLRTCAMGAFDSAKYDRISFEAVVAFDTLADVTNDYFAEIGLVGNRWSASDDLGDVRGFGHFFRYDRSQGGAKWLAVNRNLDIETAVVLNGTTQGGISTVDGGTIAPLSLPSFGFFRLKVVGFADPATGAGTHASYYVNDVLCATIATNMVTHSLAGSVAIRKTAGTTSCSLYLDYTDLSYYMREGQNREP